MFSLKRLFRTQSLHLCENTSLANLSQLGVIHVMRTIGCVLQSCHTNSIFSFVIYNSDFFRCISLVISLVTRIDRFC